VASRSAVRFKVAGEATEFDQIFELGYQTFVEEIPQHPANPRRRHVDRFHEQNTYLVAKAGDDVVGMVAVRTDRPFSLDQKLGSVDPYLPAGRRICELRLLAVRPAWRQTLVFKGLVDLIIDHGRARGYDLAIISGTLRQSRLYQRLGFIPFGPLVGTDEAPFQPMFLPIEVLQRTKPMLTASPSEVVSFLPGPVPVACDVRQAFAAPPMSHRSAEFDDLLAATRVRLLQLTRASQAEIFLGSGTLANDVIAAQLSLRPGQGVIVSNGEFGERLCDHARRMHLCHTAVAFDWGEPIDHDRLRRALSETRARWLWAVASETSTGMLNDVDDLKATAASAGAALCLDAVSAIGAVPMDLTDVALASVASGKCLGAMPGLSVVFYDAPVAPAPDRLPRYLDLGLYAANAGVPFTQSSNLIAALHAALGHYGDSGPIEEIAERAAWFREELRALSLTPLVPDGHATPAVVTLAPPPGFTAEAIATSLERQGLQIAWRSDYLRRRNWMQVAMMGATSRADLDRLVGALMRIL
jgi:aspartate aminotransferase-like enzyme/predicted N-acetyltransferase YhbS